MAWNPDVLNYQNKNAVCMWTSAVRVNCEFKWGLFQALMSYINVKDGN
jgi:hypothetical protein